MSVLHMRLDKYIFLCHSNTFSLLHLGLQVIPVLHKHTSSNVNNNTWERGIIRKSTWKKLFM